MSKIILYTFIGNTNPCKVETNAVQVASIIRRLITSGEPKPKIKIPEVELSKSLGVSRSPIGESFRILEGERLVQIRSAAKGGLTFHLFASFVTRLPVSIGSFLLPSGERYYYEKESLENKVWRCTPA